MSSWSWYFLVGGCIAAAAFLSIWLEERKGAGEPFARLGTQRRGLLWTCLWLPLRIAGAVVALAGLWPLLIAGFAVDHLMRGRRHPPLPFAVRRPDLLEPHTDEAVAERERIHDPLGAVPDLPFGHLHGAWLDFLADRQPGQVLWSFAAAGREGYTTWHRRGYVLVDGAAIGAHFIVVHRETVDRAAQLRQQRRFLQKQLD